MKKNPLLNKVVEPKEIIQLKKWDNEYYNDKESVSDDEYDSFKEETKEKYPDHHYFTEVGAEIPSSRDKIKLPYLLGSLSKKKPDGSYNKWNETHKELKIATPKLDGVSILVEFDEVGNVKKAYTRGNGEYGRDITSKAKIFVPKPDFVFNSGLVVRGEVILNKNIDYKQFGKFRRAAASGLINTDVNTNAHLIDCVFYELISSDLELETEKDRLNVLNRLFPDNSVSYESLSDNHTETDMIDVYARLTKDLPYETDGLVVTINNSVRENVKYPSHKISFKFPNKPVETEVDTVVYDVGRTGKQTPRLSIKQVEILGSDINYVTAHNYKFIRDNKIGPGSKIEVIKSGEIIPYVVSVLESKNFEELKNCVSCGSELVLSETGVDLYCINDDCRGKKLHKVAYFAKTMGMENITYNTLDNLNILSVEDLYKITEDGIVIKIGFGIKKAETILNEVIKSLEVDAYKLLAAFGIKNVGNTISKDILARHGFNDLFSLTEEDFKKIDGIGNVVAKELVKGLQDNLNLYENLLTLGLRFKEKDVMLQGKVFCLTGNGNMPRNSYIEMIEGLGGNFKSSMSKKVDILVAPDPDTNTGKMQKARSYGIKVIGYEELDEMLIQE